MRSKRDQGETGSIIKDWGGKIPIALVYPNHYRIGISNLGFQIIYSLLNQMKDVVCERFFLPESPASGHRLRSRESRRPLSDFELIAFSCPYENDYLHLGGFFRSARLPWFSRQRGDSHPLILAGGLAPTMNPEPLAEVMDFFIIGEGEQPLLEVLESYRSLRGGGREEVLKALGRVEGVYVPSGYRAGSPPLEPLPGFPPWIKRRVTFPLQDFPGHSSIVSGEMEFGRTVLCEPIRGCGRMCRFCAAGFHSLPPRFRPTSPVPGLELARKEQARIGLLGTALTDHPQFSRILEAIGEAGLKLTLSSLHGEELGDPEVRFLTEGEVRTLTLAPETGSEGFRFSLNKTVTDRKYLETARRLREGGIPHLRLYFLYGLPGEQPDDLSAIANLVERIREERRKERGRTPGRLTVSLAPFVPKPGTPLQWVRMESARELEAKERKIRAQLGKLPGVEVKTESIAAARLESLLGRGGRKMGEWLENTPRAGWRKMALAEEDPGIKADPETIFPWEIVEGRVSREYLWAEWGRAQEGTPTPGCPPRPADSRARGALPGCPGCGICRTEEKKGET